MIYSGQFKGIINLDDQEVYRLFTKGLTIGVFQFESSGMREFLKKLNEDGLPVKQITSQAIEVLKSHDWPGNIRQLRNVIDWLLIMTPVEEGRSIQVDMLPPEIGGISPSVLRKDRNVELLSMQLRDAREEFERQYLSAQVTRFGGNISRTASFVGMERSALHRKLKILGIQNGMITADQSNSDVDENQNISETS